uniref:Uncharacterized protein n=1 Tax=Tanacetum cinerariifolium TaxID=118510 RepID=A0A6L2JKL0_TANCI|nr:hypothetical protein [Tanacetum cinerariifolium]
MPLSKKEKVDVARGKGIELLSEVALTKEDQYEEVRRKSLRDFHKTHPSGFGIVTKTAPSATKIKPSVTNEGTCVKPGVPDVIKEESSESETKSWGNDEDDSNNKQDSRSEGSDEENDSDDKNTESHSKKGSDSEHEIDESESDSESDQEENDEEIGDDEEKEEGELVRTPSNDSNDETKIFDKAEGDEEEEMNYTTSQLYDDKTEVPVTSSSHSSDLASKFLNFSDIPHTDAEIVSPMDVYVHHESSYESAASLTKFELKKILIDKIDKSESYLAAPEHRVCYDGLVKSYELDKTLFSTYDKVYSLKRNQKDKDKDEDPSAGSAEG